MKTQTKSKFDITYKYYGFDNKWHIVVSRVKSVDVNQAKITLGAIIGRETIDGKRIDAKLDQRNLFYVLKTVLVHE